MRKIVYTQYGPPEVMQVKDAPIPEPGNGEILIKNMAAGINPVDFKVRNGSLKLIAPGKMPRTPGGDIAGIVEKVGSDTSRIKAGDKIFAMLNMAGGGYSEYLCIKEDLAGIIPAGFTFEEAAAVPLAGLTALQALRNNANIQKGMKVLINGGSGGVGIYAIQIARYFDAEVTAVCSSKNVEFVKRFGANHVIDYTKEDFTYSSEQFDIVFDAVAMSSPGRCKRILKKGGTYVTTVPSPATFFYQSTAFARSRKASFIMCKPGHNDLDFLAKMMSEGKLKTHIDKSYAISETTEAHKYIESGRVRGKLAIKMEH